MRKIYGLDLFGEIPVTQFDIDEWMRIEAPNISALRVQKIMSDNGM